MPSRRFPASLAILALAVATIALVLGTRPIAPRVPGSEASGTSDPAGLEATPGAATPSGAPDPSPPPAEPIGPAVGDATSPMSDHLSGDVYGFLPYWEMDATIEASLDWNALSTISLFSVGARKDGTLNRSAAGYTAIVSERGRRIIATAKARGVRTEITFTSFGRTRNAAFFGDPAVQDRTISEIRALVRDLGAEGVNVDVEQIASTWYPAYAAFCKRLRAAMRLDNPGATVSVATATDSAGARMAKAAVDAGVDRVFLMAYVYRWSGSTPGAIAPMDFRGEPLHVDLPGSLDLYAARGVPANRLILGLPLYGMTWPTAGPELGAPRTGDGDSFIPRKNLDLLARLTSDRAIAYDAQESVEWFARQDPTTATWQQTFYDSPRSLTPKLRLAVDRGLAGIGFWALGYERGLPGYWDLVKRVYGPPKLLGIRAPARVATRTIPVSLSLIAGSRALAGVQFSSDGTHWAPASAIPLLPAGAPVTAYRTGLDWTIPGTRDGTYALRVRVIDDVGTVSAVRSASVILDTTGPALGTLPTLRWSTSRGAWRIRWTAARDAAGIAGYRVRVRRGAGPWVVVKAQTNRLASLLPGIRRGATFVVQVRAIDRLGNLGPPRTVRRNP